MTNDRAWASVDATAGSRTHCFKYVVAPVSYVFAAKAPTKTVRRRIAGSATKEIFPSHCSRELKANHLSVLASMCVLKA